MQTAISFKPRKGHGLGIRSRAWTKIPCVLSCFLGTLIQQDKVCVRSASSYNENRERVSHSHESITAQVEMLSVHEKAYCNWVVLFGDEKFNKTDKSTCGGYIISIRGIIFYRLKTTEFLYIKKEEANWMAPGKNHVTAISTEIF